MAYRSLDTQSEAGHGSASDGPLQTQIWRTGGFHCGEDEAHADPEAIDAVFCRIFDLGWSLFDAFDDGFVIDVRLFHGWTGSGSNGGGTRRVKERGFFAELFAVNRFDGDWMLDGFFQLSFELKCPIAAPSYLGSGHEP